MSGFAPVTGLYMGATPLVVYRKLLLASGSSPKPGLSWRGARTRGAPLDQRPIKLAAAKSAVLGPNDGLPEMRVAIRADSASKVATSWRNRRYTRCEPFFRRSLTGSVFVAIGSV